MAVEAPSPSHSLEHGDDPSRCSRQCDTCCQCVVRYVCVYFFFVLFALLACVVPMFLDFPLYLPEVQTSIASYVRVVHIHTDYADALDAAKELMSTQDQCSSSPCVHGTCTDLPNDQYSCECEAGYTGTDCDTSQAPSRRTLLSDVLGPQSVAKHALPSSEAFKAMARYPNRSSSAMLLPPLTLPPDAPEPVYYGYDHAEPFARTARGRGRRHRQRRRRQLQDARGIVPTRSFYLFYLACNDGVVCKQGANSHANVFNQQSMADVRDFETSLIAFIDDGSITKSLGIQYEAAADPPAFKDYCYAYADGSCVSPTSAVNFFFPTVSGTGSVGSVNTQTVKFDGKGPWFTEPSTDGTQPPACVLAPDTGCAGDLECEKVCVESLLSLMAEEDMLFFMDRYFSSSNLTSTTTQSQFSFGLPAPGFSFAYEDSDAQSDKINDYFERMYWGLLRSSAFKYDNIRIAWYSGSAYTFEILTALFEDGLLAGGSFMFVLIYMTIYLRSFWLSFMALLGILLSFPIAYVIYRVPLDFQEFNLLNFLALFLILGIGADDAFVFMDIWNSGSGQVVDSDVDTPELSNASAGDMDEAKIDEAGADASPKEKQARKRRLRLERRKRKADAHVVRVALALRRAWMEGGKAMLITSLTTAASFFANVASAIGVIKEFGIFMGLTVLINFVIIMTLFPLVATIWERWKCFQCGCPSNLRRTKRRARKANQSKHEALRDKRRNSVGALSVDRRDALALDAAEAGEIRQSSEGLDDDDVDEVASYVSEDTSDSDHDGDQPSRPTSIAMSVWGGGERHSLSRAFGHASMDSIRNQLALEAAAEHLRQSASFANVQAAIDLERDGSIRVEAIPAGQEDAGKNGGEAGGGGGAAAAAQDNRMHACGADGGIRADGVDANESGRVASAQLSVREVEEALLDMKVGKEWPCLARCFFNCCAPLCRYNRLAIPLIIVWLTLSALSVWLTITFLRPADAVPQFFTEENNLGIAEILRTQYFTEGATSESALLPTGDVATTQYSCAPAADCSGHGVCLAPQYVCECAAGYKGADCASQTVPGFLSLSPTSTLRVEVTGAGAGQAQDGTVVVANGGDTAVHFFVDPSATEASGLCYPSACYDPQYPQSASTAATLQPGESVELTFTLTTLPGQGEGVAEVSSLDFHWREEDTGEGVFTVQQLRVEVVYGTSYYLDSMYLSCGSEGFAFVPSFTSFVFAYTTSRVSFECRSELALLVTGSDLPTDIVRAELTTINGGVSTNSTLEPTSLLLNIGTFDLPTLPGGGDGQSSAKLRIILLGGVVYNLNIVVETPASSSALSSIVVVSSLPDGNGGRLEVAAALDPAFSSTTYAYEVETNPFAESLYFASQTTATGVGLEDIVFFSNYSSNVVATTFDGRRVFEVPPPPSAGGQVSLSLTAQDGESTSVYQISVLNADVRCSGTGSLSELGITGVAALDCSAARQIGSTCNVTPDANFNCSGVLVSCAYSASTQQSLYEVQGSCDALCDGFGPLEGPPVGVLSLDCSAAISPGSVCVVVEEVNYDCTEGLSIECGQNGQYQVAGACEPVCDGMFSVVDAAAQAVNGIGLADERALVRTDCASARAQGQRCLAQFNSTFYDCSGVVECLGGSDGYDASSLNCTPRCQFNLDDPNVQLDGGMVTCGDGESSRWTNGSDCEIRANPGYDCMGVSAFCLSDMTSGDPAIAVLDTVGECSVRCSGTTPPNVPILADPDYGQEVSVDCSSATEFGTECEVSVVDSAALDCASATVTCSLGGNYTASGQCERLCNPAASIPDVRGVTVDCTGASRVGSTCFIGEGADPATQGFNCSSVIVECAPNGSYTATGECLPQCSEDADSAPSFIGGSADCRGAIEDGDQCVVAAFSGYVCEDVNISCVVDQASAVYESTGAASDCQRVCSTIGPTVAGATVDCSAAPNVGDSCNILPAVNYRCDGLLSVECGSNGRYRKTGSCEVQCSGNISDAPPQQQAPVIVGGAASIDCSTATQAGTSCSIVADAGFSCDDVSVVCSATGDGYVSGGDASCTQLCSGTFADGMGSVGGASVINCSLAVNPGDLCVITADTNYDCSGLSIACAASGSAQYARTGRCQAVCSGLLSDSSVLVPNASSVDCSLARESLQTCDVVADEGFDCRNVSVTCGSNGEGYLVAGRCVLETCSDGIRNQDEERVDCGGTCDACATQVIGVAVSVSFDSSCLADGSCTEAQLVANISASIVAYLGLPEGTVVDVGPLFHNGNTGGSESRRLMAVAAAPRRHLAGVILTDVSIIFDPSLACVNATSGLAGILNAAGTICVVPSSAIAIALSGLGVDVNHVVGVSECNPAASTPPVAGAVVGCGAAIEHGDSCVVQSNEGWNCSGVEVVCTTNSSGTGAYFVIGACSAECFGTYNGGAVEGATIDCAAAMRGGDQCVIASLDGYDCGDLDVVCRSDGSTQYEPTVSSCLKLCDGNAAPTVDGGVVNCTEAEYPATECSIVENDGFDCSVVGVSCSSDGSGNYLLTGSASACVPVCDGSTQSFFGGTSDCSQALVSGAACVVSSKNSRFDCSNVTTLCLDGEYVVEGACHRQCSGSFQDSLIQGASVDCSAARNSGDNCTVVNATPAFDCTDVVVTCDANVGYIWGTSINSFDACAALCDPSAAVNYDFEDNVLVFPWGTADCSVARNDREGTNACAVMVNDSSYVCDSKTVQCSASSLFEEGGTCEAKCNGLYANASVLDHVLVDCTLATEPQSQCEITLRSEHACDGTPAVQCTDGAYAFSGICYKTCDSSNAPLVLGAASVDCSSALQVGEECALTPGMYMVSNEPAFDCSQTSMTCTEGYGADNYATAGGMCVPVNEFWDFGQSGVNNFTVCTVSLTDTNCALVNPLGSDSSGTCVLSTLVAGSMSFSDFTDIDVTVNDVSPQTVQLNGGDSRVAGFVDVGDVVTISWPAQALSSAVMSVCLNDAPACDGDATNTIPNIAGADIDCTTEASSGAAFVGGFCSVSAQTGTIDCSAARVVCTETGNYSASGECSISCDGDGSSILSDHVNIFDSVDCASATAPGSQCSFSPAARYDCGDVNISCGDLGSYSVSGNCIRNCSGSFSGCTGSWCSTPADLPGAALTVLGTSVVLEPAATVTCAEAVLPTSACNLTTRPWYTCEGVSLACEPLDGVYEHVGQSDSCSLTSCSPVASLTALQSLSVVGDYTMAPTFAQGSTPSGTDFVILEEVSALTESIVLRLRGEDALLGVCSVFINNSVADFNPASNEWSGSLDLLEGATTTVEVSVGPWTQYFVHIARGRKSTNANLSSLGLPAALQGGLTVEPLSPGPFDPGIFDYTLTLQNSVSSLALRPVAQHAGAAVLVNGQFAPGTSVSLPAVFGPFSPVNFTVLVVAESGLQQIYILRVFRPGYSCPGAGDCAGHGACNLNYGSCSCDVDWHGPSCTSYCPDDCGSQGTCDTTIGCVCRAGYAGPGCTDQVCPGFGTPDGNCSSRGTCSGTFECLCDDGAAGNDCSKAVCPNTDPLTGIACGGNGTCLANGTCACNFDYAGAGCDQFVGDPFLLPWSRTAQLTLLWGIGDQTSSEGHDPVVLDTSQTTEDFPYGLPVFDPTFDPSTEAAQMFLFEACQWAAGNETRLALREPNSYYSSGYCFMDYFHSVAVAYFGGFPVDPQQFNAAVQLTLDINNYFTPWVGLSDGWPASCATADTGSATTLSADGCRVTFIGVSYRLNVNSIAPASESQPVYDEWNSFTDSLNAAAPPEVSHSAHTCDAWTVMIVELEAVSGAVTAASISVGCALIAVVFFTGNLLLSLYVGLSIAMIVVCLAAVIIYVLNWPFGLMESISLTVFVGFSVDYVLHLGHAYNESPWHSPYLKTRDALAHIGPSILSAAVTTCGSAFFLLFCQIYLFVQMGWTLLVNTALAILCALTFFVAVTALLGPRHRCCDFYGKCRGAGVHDRGSNATVEMRKKRESKCGDVVDEHAIELVNIHAGDASPIDIGSGLVLNADGELQVDSKREHPYEAAGEEAVDSDSDDQGYEK